MLIKIFFYFYVYMSLFCNVMVAAWHSDSQPALSLVTVHLSPIITIIFYCGLVVHVTDTITDYVHDLLVYLYIPQLFMHCLPTICFM